MGLRTLILDGDAVRDSRTKKLGFTRPDILLNNGLIADACLEQQDRHDVILVPIISPFKEGRDAARKKLAPNFFEIFVFADIPELERRDTKGLYARARSGDLSNLIGYSPGAVYEVPESPDLTINTQEDTVDASSTRLASFIVDQRRLLSALK